MRWQYLAKSGNENRRRRQAAHRAFCRHFPTVYENHGEQGHCRFNKTDGMQIAWTSDPGLHYELAPTAMLKNNGIVYVPSNSGLVIDLAHGGSVLGSARSPMRSSTSFRQGKIGWSSPAWREMAMLKPGTEAGWRQYLHTAKWIG
jgi:hypothetical protein